MKHLYQIGDAVLWYGELASVEQVEPRTNGKPDYFIRFASGHTWVNEIELEPYESND
jgi:hypothetical protein